MLIKLCPNLLDRRGFVIQILMRLEQHNILTTTGILVKMDEPKRDLRKRRLNQGDMAGKRRSGMKTRNRDHGNEKEVVINRRPGMQMRTLRSLPVWIIA